MRTRAILSILIALVFIIPPITSQAQTETQSIIIEVEGNPHEQKEYIEAYYPTVEVLEVYDTLFQGLALRGKAHQLDRLNGLDFLKKAYPVQTYQITEEAPINESVPFLLQDEVTQESLSYTGKGVKIGVIDTGIDYQHPDLEKNYKGGFDLVDMDADPMETQVEQGLSTIHGTHVAGIIAANGKMKGVAPDADLYGYRALGPGGAGTSVQVIAALEKAVKDGMDIINMSLGNTINGPDWPTSIAVNRAVDEGVSVVIANGNSGPDDWTVGSPATATKSIGVGSSTPPIKTASLYDSFENKKIELITLAGAPAWDLQKKYPIVNGGDGKKAIPDARGKIVLIERGDISFTEKAKQAETSGAAAVLIYNNEKGTFQGGMEQEISIPVTGISQADGEWLLDQLDTHSYWIETDYQITQDQISDFSSRGPVTANWQIKPEIVAPGAQITSTVPGGYQTLQGTSMAAPHIAGSLAVLKEAHPDWTPTQLKGALLTQALPLTDGEQLYEPIEQGMGRIRLSESINTATIITNPLLSFGKINTGKESNVVNLEVKNVSGKPQTYSFDLPEQTKGLRWYTPKTFTIEPGQTEQVPIELAITSSLLEPGLYQGWLELSNQEQTFSLPYMYVNQMSNFPKAMGFELELTPFQEKNYTYRFYSPEVAEKITVDLYDPNTLTFQQTLFSLDDPEPGVIEGEIPLKLMPKKGEYIADISVETEKEEVFHYQMNILIE
ncbi:S8 family serine peptidase [Paraliobacillus sp. X-1268]|uniref:S8 family serine peptidase n=1 Tax=Paraliobacillus sp. X-1268 TaxID=2213193 RepID=UPI000E3D5A3E|nr:S8 family serine peptidase [Paraliobacillus sp. X-1268]